MQVTTSIDGQPICPVCGDDVLKAGEFCGPVCYTHFINAVEGQEVVHMEYIDLTAQPWYDRMV